jgi:hypothetical protein
MKKAGMPRPKLETALPNPPGLMAAKIGCERDVAVAVAPASVALNRRPV